MSNKINIKQVMSTLRKRNPERVLMDRNTTPKVFKARRNELNAKDAQREINDYQKGIE